jgi:peptidoglycan/LPS O-acetylase OafA/YrhL
MEPVPTDWQSPLRPVFYAWSLSGGQGVDLFFVLSGFLVSGLLFAEFKKYGRISIRRFYIRRAWKIYPAFYVLIAATYLYQKFGIGHKMTDVEKVSELFFLQSYVQGFWNHTWTLAVEEHSIWRCRYCCCGWRAAMPDKLIRSLGYRYS